MMVLRTPKRKLEYSRRYYRKHRKQVIARVGQWKQDHPEWVHDKNKRYYKKNKKYYQIYYKENRNAILLKRRKYCRKNRNAINAYQRQYYRKKRLSK